MPRQRNSPKNNKMDKAMRERIVYSVFEEHMTIAQTARRLFLPASTVGYVVREFQEGKTDVRPRGGAHNRKLFDEHFLWIQNKVRWPYLSTIMNKISLSTAG